MISYAKGGDSTGLHAASFIQNSWILKNAQQTQEAGGIKNKVFQDLGIAHHSKRCGLWAKAATTRKPPQLMSLSIHYVSGPNVSTLSASFHVTLITLKGEYCEYLLLPCPRSCGKWQSGTETNMSRFWSEPLQWRRKLLWTRQMTHELC